MLLLTKKMVLHGGFAGGGKVASHDEPIHMPVKTMRMVPDVDNPHIKNYPESR